MSGLVDSELVKVMVCKTPKQIWDKLKNFISKNISSLEDRSNEDSEEGFDESFFMDFEEEKKEEEQECDEEVNGEVNLE